MVVINSNRFVLDWPLDCEEEKKQALTIMSTKSGSVEFVLEEGGGG
jgi:hypothetical protein